MTKRNTTKAVEELRTLAGKLADTPGLTWVEANNAIYGPGGPFVRLFPTKADRAAFSKTKARQEIDELIDSLPDPPVGPQRQEFSGKFNVRIPKSLHAAIIGEATSTVLLQASVSRTPRQPNWRSIRA
jgi:HicB family